MKTTLMAPLLRFGERLRFPWLFAITAVLLVVNVLVPDVIPFADEIILGLVTLVLGSLKKRRQQARSDSSPADRD